MARTKTSLARCVLKRHSGTYSQHKQPILYRDRAYIADVTNIHVRTINGIDQLVGRSDINGDGVKLRVTRLGKKAWVHVPEVELINQAWELGNANLSG